MTAGGTIFGNSDESYILPEGHPKHISSSAGKYINRIPGESSFPSSWPRQVTTGFINYQNMISNLVLPL